MVCCHWITPNFVTALILYIPSNWKLKIPHNSGTVLHTWTYNSNLTISLIYTLDCVINEMTSILLSLIFHIWPAIYQQLLLMSFIFNSSFDILMLVHTLAVKMTFTLQNFTIDFQHEHTFSLQFIKMWFLRIILQYCACYQKISILWHCQHFIVDHTQKLSSAGPGVQFFPFDKFYLIFKSILSHDPMQNYIDTHMFCVHFHRKFNLMYDL